MEWTLFYKSNGQLSFWFINTTQNYQDQVCQSNEELNGQGDNLGNAAGKPHFAQLNILSIWQQRLLFVLQMSELWKSGLQHQFF